MGEMLQRLLKKKEGQGMLEYGLIIAAVALVVIVVMWAFGDQIKGLFGTMSLTKPAA